MVIVYIQIMAADIITQLESSASLAHTGIGMDIAVDVVMAAKNLFGTRIICCAVIGVANA